MPRPLRTLALVVASAGLATVATITVTAPTAQAETWANNNEWWYSMTEPGDGLVIIGDDGPENNNALLVRDYLGQPIFAVSEAGGAAMLGDQFRVMHGSDPFNAQLTFDPHSNPNEAICVREHQMWFGGADGGIWECTWTGSGYDWQPWTG